MSALLIELSTLRSSRKLELPTDLSLSRARQRESLLRGVGGETRSNPAATMSLFQARAMVAQELVDPRFGVPVLDEVQPALVAEENARVKLHAAPLIVAKIARFETERALKPIARLSQVAHRHSDVLQTEYRHFCLLPLR